MVTKEELPIIFGGAITTGVIDGAIEMVHASNPEKWSGVFPFLPTIEPLPPLDDWIVLAVPAVAYGIGHFAKKEKLKAFGLGGLLYAVPTFIHHIIIRSIWATGIKFERQLQLPLIKEI